MHGETIKKKKIHTIQLKLLKLLKIVKVIKRTICVVKGSTTTPTNTVYILHILCYSRVAIASSPVQVFHCG